MTFIHLIIVNTEPCVHILDLLSMSVKDSTHEYRLSQWLTIIKECRSSGMPVKRWCEQNDVNEKRFYYWQRKLREAASKSLPTTMEQPTFVQVSSSVQLPSVSPVTDFVPARVLKVGNVSLELSDTVQPELLATALKVLSHAK